MSSCRRVRNRFPVSESVHPRRPGIEEGASERIDEVGLDLIPNTASAIRQVRKTDRLDCGPDIVSEGDCRAARRPRITENVFYHSVEDLPRDAFTDEVEH